MTVWKHTRGPWRIDKALEKSYARGRNGINKRQRLHVVAPDESPIINLTGAGQTAELYNATAVVVSQAPETLEAMERAYDLLATAKVRGLAETIEQARDLLWDQINKCLPPGIKK